MYRFSFPPPIYELHIQHLVLSVYFILVILTGMQWYLIMVLISLPYWLMMLNSSCSYLPSVYNLWSSVYSNLLFIFNWVVCFLSVVLRDLYILCKDIYKPFVEYMVCQFFFTQFVVCLSIFLTVSPSEWKFSILMNSLPNSRSQRFFNVFSYRILQFYI